MKPLHPFAAVLSALITASLFQGVASLARPAAQAAPQQAAAPASSRSWLADAHAALTPAVRN